VTCHALGCVDCVTLKDFSDLHSIAFGVNLALPVFRELVVFNRRTIVARLPALQSIVESATYTVETRKQEHLAALTSAKVNLLAYDKELDEKINLCSVVTFMFALASLGWLTLGIYNSQCLTGWAVFASVWLNFLPLPASVGFLWWKSRSLFSELNQDIDQLMRELM
jgi:hypothetical protein